MVDVAGLREFGEASDEHMIIPAGDLSEKYHVYRSFRRGSESRAVLAKEVSVGDRYQINRWTKKEKAKSSKMLQPIDQLYIDVTLVKEAFLRYTKAM